MQISFIDVLITVASLVVLAVPGFILVKAKMLPEKAAETVSTIVLYVCQTAMVFLGFQNYEFNPSIGLNMLYVFGLTLVVHFAMIVIVSCFVKGKEEAKIKAVRYGSVFGNCGYMGFPLLAMLFGNTSQFGEIMIYAAVVITVWNLLNWTVGVYMITGDKKQISFKKIIFNPVIIAVVLGFLVFVISKKPIVDWAAQGSTLDAVLEKLISSVEFFSNAVTPLSMTVIGMRLANIKFKQLFTEKLAYLHCALKLVLMGIIAVLVVSFIPVSQAVKYTIFFTMAMPAATSTTLFTVKFGGDSEFASVCVLLSTILSIVTIPLMFLLAQPLMAIV